VILPLGFLSAAAEDVSEMHALRNTGGWFVAGEFVASGLVGFLLPDLVLGEQPETLTCADAWCEVGGFDTAMRDLLRAGNPKPVGTVSHVFTVGLVPAVGAAALIVPAAIEGEAGEGVADAVIMVNAFLVATGPNSIAKVTARRQRPAFHFGVEDQTEAAGHPDEEFVSFYSGDTTWAFALASSSTTLSFLRDHDWAPITGISTGVLALTGGALRVTADMHWTTDVIAGAVAGTAIGVALPLALHGRKQGDGATLVPTGNGFAIVGCW